MPAPASEPLQVTHALPIFHITSTSRACPAVHRRADGVGMYGDASAHTSSHRDASINPHSYAHADVRSLPDTYNEAHLYT